MLALIVAAAKLSGAAANRIGQPAVFGEILAGLVLGPTVLDVLGWPIFAHALQPAHGRTAGAADRIVRDLAELGVILLMFIAGLETDLVEMRRVGRVAFWAAFGGVVLPLAGGAVTAVAFGLPLFWTGLFIGTILTATSVSISAQTLMELNALRSREGLHHPRRRRDRRRDGDHPAVGRRGVRPRHRRGQRPGDCLDRRRGWCSFSGARSSSAGTSNAIGAWAERLAVSQGLLAVVLVVALLYAWAAEFVGGVAADHRAPISPASSSRRRASRQQSTTASTR